MFDSGHWLFPHRGTELYSDKPPMLMWWQATLYSLVGQWRVAFLLPSLLAALGTLWCVVDLGRRLWTRRVGLYAGWALLFALQFTFQAKKAQIDPLLLLFITLANYGLLRHPAAGPAWRWWWLGWFFAGIGVITRRGHAGAADDRARGNRHGAAVATGGPARATRASGAAGLPAGGVVVAGADAAGRLCHRLGRISRLHGRYPVSGRRRGATPIPGITTSPPGTSWRRCR
jgi:hypothetical protein